MIKHQYEIDMACLKNLGRTVWIQLAGGLAVCGAVTLHQEPGPSQPILAYDDIFRTYLQPLDIRFNSKPLLLKKIQSLDFRGLTV